MTAATPVDFKEPFIDRLSDVVQRAFDSGSGYRIAVDDGYLPSFMADWAREKVVSNITRESFEALEGDLK